MSKLAKCHHCDRSWPTEEEARLRADVERERVVAAAERALRKAVENETVEKTLSAAQALMHGRNDSEAVRELAAAQRAVDEARVALRALGVSP